MKAERKEHSAEAWLDSLERLVITSCAAPPEKEAVYLGKLLCLLHDAPEPALLTDLALPARQDDLALTDQQTCASLALALLEGNCFFMISKGSEQLFIASVVLPDGDEETTASGSTLALALIGAIALAVLDLARALQCGVVRSASV